MVKSELAEIRLPGRARRTAPASPAPSEPAAAVLDEAFAALEPELRRDPRHNVGRRQAWDSQHTADQLAQQGHSLDHQCERLSKLLEDMADEA